MNEDRSIWWWALGAIVIAGAAGAYWWWQGRAPQPVPPPVVQAPAAEEKAAPPAVEHPIDTAPAAQSAQDQGPLPPLAESDSALRAAIAGLIGEKSLLEFFHMQGIAARIVATIDNLPRGKVAQKILPLRGPGGSLAVEARDGENVIAAANAQRYAAYVKLAEAVDGKKLAALYVRFYPLLEEAYRELGYPGGHFNDRLVAVIDHLLATPDIQGPVKLSQPKVLYEFADPALESRSAGQKLLLRMGPENAARVKARLREFRREVTAQPPQ